MSRNRGGERKPDRFELRARELATAAGYDPNTRVQEPGQKEMPAWCLFRPEARREHDMVIAADEAAKAAIPPQPAEFQNSPLEVFGDHDPATIEQMWRCMAVGNVVKGVVCADGHLGYAQPVGGVVAYDGHISISGVGFDIGCGNMAVKLDTPFTRIKDAVGPIIRDVSKVISFGVGRTNIEKVESPVLDDADAFRAADMSHYRAKAASQLGTVGSGNHYVDLMTDEDGHVWIGVHFGSRGLGHQSATKYLKMAGGKDGMHVPPAVLSVDSELGQRYIAAMELAGRYAAAGREWVVNRVRKIVGGKVLESVHNHHNYAWLEEHDGRKLWVVRKGATPAFPGQRGFVGGSMGDDAVIIEGVDSERSKAALYSTVHGAGRLFGRKEAKRRFDKAEMDRWLNERGVTLVGADIDESPMAYRRLPEVIARHAGTIKVIHTLRPFAVAMAGEKVFDPFKD